MGFQVVYLGRHMSIYMNHVHSNASTEHSVLAPDVIFFPKRKGAKAQKGSVTTTITIQLVQKDEKTCVINKLRNILSTPSI